MSFLSDALQPTKYALQFVVDLLHQTFETHSEITAVVKRSASALRVHVKRSCVVTAATVNGAAVAAHREGADPDVLVLAHAASLNDVVVIVVKLRGAGSAAPTGLYFVRNAAYTQLQPVHARSVFACIDEPAAKAVFRVSVQVLHAPDDVVCLSNAAVQRRAENGVVHFAPTPAMSTYVLALVVGSLRQLSRPAPTLRGRTLDVTLSVLRDVSVEAVMERTLGIVCELVTRACAFLRSAAPFDALPKLDVVAVPDFDGAAMENWGLIVCDCAMLKGKTGANTRDIMAHELMHQWFGNVLTPAWWNDLWLSESLSTYAAAWLVHEMGYSNMRQSWCYWLEEALFVDVVDASRGALRAVEEPVLAVSPRDTTAIESQFDERAYFRGALIVHWLRRRMGGAAFLSVLRKYVDTAAPVVRADDFWRHCAGASAKRARALMQSAELCVQTTTEDILPSAILLLPVDQLAALRVGGEAYAHVCTVMRACVLTNWHYDAQAPEVKQFMQRNGIAMRARSCTARGAGGAPAPALPLRKWAAAAACADVQWLLAHLDDVAARLGVFKLSDFMLDVAQRTWARATLAAWRAAFRRRPHLARIPSVQRALWLMHLQVDFAAHNM